MQCGIIQPFIPIAIKHQTRLGGNERQRVKFHRGDMQPARSCHASRAFFYLNFIVYFNNLEMCVLVFWQKEQRFER